MKNVAFEKKQGEPVDIRRLSAFLQSNVPLLANGLWQLVIEKPNRTDLENRTFWGWLRLISEETGNGQRDLYAYYCERFNPQRCTYFKDGRFSRGGTSDLNTKDFALLLTEIKADAASELGIVLPTSEDAAFDDFYESYIK